MSARAEDPMAIEALVLRSAAGDAAASNALFSLLFDEFKSRARAVLRLAPSNTLSTTELVSETWLRLNGRRFSAADRQHYFNIAARAMRQVLIDRARIRQAQKRGHDSPQITLGGIDDVVGDDPLSLLIVDQAMTSLATIDAELAELAALYLFAGMNAAEIAELRGVSERTVFRDWRTARLYLLQALEQKP